MKKKIILVSVLSILLVALILTIVFMLNNNNDNSNPNVNKEKEEEISIKVTFDVNGGNVDITEKDVVYQDVYGELPIPTYENHKFIGWYTEPEKGRKIEDISPVSIKENHTLYAHWEEDTYKTGDFLELGGYKWHVIGEYKDEQDRSLVTLLMDANQLGEYSKMAHCTDDTDESTDCGVTLISVEELEYSALEPVYSWNKSLIRTYLNSTLLGELEHKIPNEIVTTSICADSSRNGKEVTYGGYLMSELNILDKASECTTQVNDKIRLISPSEYYNMSPIYVSIDSNHPNVENITRLSSDDSSWFQSSDIDSDDDWWTMGATNMMDMGFYPLVECVTSYGWDFYDSDRAYDVRPVITIVK